MGTCRYCNQSAGFLRKQHGQCRDLHAQGMRERPQLTSQAAGTAGFNETALRNTLQSIATRARATHDDISTMALMNSDSPHHDPVSHPRERRI